MDLSKGVSKDLQKKLDQWDKQSPANKQLRALEDLASITQELLDQGELSSKGTEEFKKSLAPTLLDIRESLQAIRNQEVKEVDNSPIVDAVKRVEKAFSKLEIKPEFKPIIKVDTPKVDVSPPDVDLKGMERLLKTEIPKAFDKAIKSIPKAEQPKLTDYSDKFDAMLEELASIDKASRMKPQAKTYKTNTSNQLEVSLVGEALVAGTDFDYIDVQQTSATVDTFVFKLGGSGGTTVQTIVLTFIDAAKTDIDTVAWA